MRTLWKLIVGFFAAIGMFVVVSTTVTVVSLLFFADRPESLPDKILLRVNLEKGLRDGPPRSNPLGSVRGVTLQHAVEALRQAKDDERVAGLVVYLGGARMGFAGIQELRAAVADFRAAGKFAWIFTEDLGGIGGGTGQYYLASAFEQIWVQPSGGVGLIGMSIEVPFGKGVLEKLEVEPRFGQRHEYKSAVESFTRSSLSDPARENLRALLDSLYGQAVAGIAESRGMEDSQVRNLVDNGPYLAREALEARLVDRLGYWDEFFDEAEALAGEGAEEVTLSRYAARMKKPDAGGTRVALIHGRGAIVPGSADDDPFGEPGFGAHRIAEAIAEATDDETIKAILFRIDSPGGSYIASDIVWREMRRAREAGKPVVVSMGGTAASGGYFVAMPADRVVAYPGTVTGSIGVYGGKVVTEKFWEKLGVTWDGMQAGERAAMWSMVRDFPPGAEERFAAMLDFIYEDFTAKAMEDRSLTAEQLDAVARGRVWTGEDALRHGLVDVLGGYPTAMNEVRDLLGLEEGAALSFVSLPKPLDPFEQFLKAMDPGASSQPIGRALGLGEGGVLEMAARELGLPAEDLEIMRPSAGVLQMPPMLLRY